MLGTNTMGLLNVCSTNQPTSQRGTKSGMLKTPLWIQFRLQKQTVASIKMHISAIVLFRLLGFNYGVGADNTLCVDSAPSNSEVPLASCTDPEWRPAPLARKSTAAGNNQIKIINEGTKKPSQ